MILLTALPRTGKSTAIKKIVNMLGVDNCGGFYTEEIRENDERVGFRIKTITGKTAILAHVDYDSEYRISRYGVDLKTFENICLDELEEALSNDSIKYLIIDEIGPMQLFSDKYKELLVRLLDCDKVIIGTVFMNSYEWLDDFKKRDGVNLVEITFDNRDSMPLKIVKEVTKSDSIFQRKVEKALRYSLEDTRFELSDNRVIVNSEHGVRTISKENDRFICDCDYYKECGTCSHIMAILNSNLINDVEKENKESKQLS